MTDQEQQNTQTAEDNSVSNPSTQAEERNDVPYTRFQEVNGQKNQFKSENESLKAELAKVKAAQEDARQDALKKNSEFETLYNESDATAKKLAEQNKANAGKTDSSRAGTTAKGEMGGFDSWEEFASKDPVGAEKALMNTTQGFIR